MPASCPRGVRNNAGARATSCSSTARWPASPTTASAGDVVVFPHTEIEADRRGQGLGAELVRGALDDVRRTGGHGRGPAAGTSPSFIDENPEYHALLLGETPR